MIAVLRRHVVCNGLFENLCGSNLKNQVTLKTASAWIVEASVPNNSPSQDSYCHNGIFLSGYVTPGFKPFFLLMLMLHLNDKIQLRENPRLLINGRRRNIKKSLHCYNLYFSLIFFLVVFTFFALKIGSSGLFRSQTFRSFFRPPVPT